MVGTILSDLVEAPFDISMANLKKNDEGFLDFRYFSIRKRWVSQTSNVLDMVCGTLHIRGLTTTKTKRVFDPKL